MMLSSYHHSTKEKTNPVEFKNKQPNRNFRIKCHWISFFSEIVFYTLTNTRMHIPIYKGGRHSVWFINWGLYCTWHCLLDSLNIVWFINNNANWWSLIDHFLIVLQLGFFSPWILFLIWVPVTSVRVSSIFLSGKNMGEKQ